MYTLYICTNIDICYYIGKGGAEMATSKAQLKATLKYKNKNYKRIPLDVKNEEYEKIKKYIKGTGETVNGFLS